MKQNLILACILVMLQVNLSVAQTSLTGREANKRVELAQRIDINDKTNTYKFIVLSEAANISEANAVQWMQKTFNETSPLSEFKFTKVKKDQLAMVHKDFQQWFGNYRIEHSVLKMHFKHGKLLSVNGEYTPVFLPLTNVINVDSIKAKEIASHFFDKENIEPINFETKIAEILYAKDAAGNLQLCYKLDVNASPMVAKRAYVYVNAANGKIVNSENRIHETVVPATAITKYCDTVGISVDSINATTHYLRETGSRNIHTWNLNTGSNYSSATEFVNVSTVWNPMMNDDKAALDAHYGSEKTWDYFNNNFALNSYDNLGTTINSYVHYGSGFVNAFWDGTQMTYGDGDGVNYGPLTSTDVVGHEIMHAITENAAGLIYSQESGALNESFSDIFGVVIDYYANPLTANFLMGDQFSFSGLPFRNLSTPNLTNDPDTYLGTFWDVSQEVHKNSPPSTFAFYLQCFGGSGTNDIGNAYTVNPITMASAAAIAYRNLSVYLTPNTNYADARTYAIQSALDLYGSCSNEVINVTNSWYAIGVGGVFSAAVIAAYTSVDTFKCTVPASVSFTNISVNATSYLWDFGDGTNSTVASPTHVYNSYGNFTVTLYATGVAACGNYDTLIKTNFINVINIPSPIAAACTNSSTAFCCGNGIGNVNLGTLNFTTNDASEGAYKDFTCGNNVALIAGDPYAINITTTSTNPQYVSAYIDYNNDGTFTASELAYTSAALVGSHSGIISTQITATLGVPLRMRVLSSDANILNACVVLNNGQAEDYSVTFSAATGAPIADFMYLPNNVTTGNAISFTDLTTNGASSWQWSFSGASFASSTLQNPVCSFNSVGTQTVTLIATNGFGSDTVTKLVVVSNIINLCNPSSVQVTTAPSGLLYDSGGLTNNYSINENCSLLISPLCADSITFNITNFQTESSFDYLRVYDGTDITGTLLLNYSGYQGPISVVATSGNMFINFNTDGSVSYAGFEASWETIQYSIALPTANFSFSPINPPLLDTVHFVDASSSNTNSWLWLFGDGNTSTLQNPTHNYTSSGTFTVTLISKTCVLTDTFTSIINVQAAPNLVFNPSSFSVSLGCNDTVAVNLDIINTGAGTLLWQNSGAGNNVLIWNYGSDTSSGGEYYNTINAINQYFTNYTLSSTSTSIASQLQTDLIGKKVLLITENKSGLSTVSTSCATVIQNFVSNGGTVIVLGDYITVQNLGIFNQIGLVNTSGNNLTVSNTSTPITNGVATNLFSANATFYRQFSDVSRIAIIQENSSNYEVVTYMPYGSGKAIYIGFDYYSYDSNAAKIIANAVSWGINGNSSSNTNVTLSSTSGTVLPGDTSNVMVTINSSGLSGGLDTMYVYFNTNNPPSFFDSVAIYLNISLMPCVEFVFTENTDCSGIINFVDSTTNAPVSWLWNFGDGATSTLQNPSHTYAAAGTYSVTLIATNALGTDSISKTVVLTNVGGPISASCMSIQTSSNGAVGMSNVTLNTINNSTGSSVDGIMDYTCSQSTNLMLGSTYTLSVTTLYSENAIAWIDFNNDGIFSSSEILGNTTNGYNHSMTFIVPINAVANTSLRMRVGSEYNSTPTPCYAYSFGQSEDYTVKLIGSYPPITAFIASPNNVWINQNVQFADITTNTPTTWQWSLPGSTNPAATSQNPLVSYPVAGVYNTSLTTSNIFGSNTATLNNYITVNALPYVNFNYSNCSGQVSFNSNLQTPYTSVSWNFGDGGIANNATPTISHTYLAAGIYTVSYTANSVYGSTTYTNTINVQFWNPTVSISGSFIPNGNINFSINSVNAISTYNWNLGDGSFSAIANPLHSYLNPGTYFISCILVDSNNCQYTVKDTIQILAEGITNLSNDLEILVSPNPFDNFIEVEVLNLTFGKQVELKLFNAIGQEVYAQKEKNATLSKRKFVLKPKIVSGNYMLQIKVDDKKTIYKLLKR